MLLNAHLTSTSPTPRVISLSTKGHHTPATLTTAQNAESRNLDGSKVANLESSLQAKPSTPALNNLQATVCGSGRHGECIATVQRRRRRDRIHGKLGRLGMAAQGSWEGREGEHCRVDGDDDRVMEAVRWLCLKRTLDRAVRSPRPSELKCSLCCLPSSRTPAFPLPPRRTHPTWNPLTTVAAIHLQAFRRGRPCCSCQRRPLCRQARRHCRDYRPQPRAH